MTLSSFIFDKRKKMFNLFSKKHLSAVLALLSLNASLVAEEFCYSQEIANEYCCPTRCNRLYIGGFGGGLYSNSSRVVQTGTAFFTEAEGGPLAVNAHGHAKKKSTGFGGVQIGYEWTQCPLYVGCSGWTITPAAEIEAYFYKHTRKGDLINVTDRLPEHDFVDSFPMRVGVYLVNGVLTLNHCSLGRFSPYIGGGVGAARIHVRKADSLQVSPPEAGVNHFNSDRSNSTWAFAAQAKAGLKYNICERFHLFMEYRFSFIDTSNFIFGSTNSPGHAPTSTWNVEVKDMCYNAFAIGLQYDL